jgi:hypothetical protein
MEIIMRRLLGSLVAIPIALVTVSSADAQAVEDIVAAAVMPLPEDLRAEATVYTYDASTGQRTVLRQGMNHVACRPKDDDGFTICESSVMAARRDLSDKLEAEGKTGEALQAALAAAEANGTIEPVPFGSMLYRLSDSDERIKLLWVVRLPNATSEQLGMPTGSQRDNALAGQGYPWMMREGTPGAHLMIPINRTELSNTGGAETRAQTKAMGDLVAQAVLPLPEDLRDEATVVSYDSKTGERRMLRQGSNMLECQPRDAESGFTRCYHKSRGPEFDLRAKLSVQGKSDEEIQAEVTAARTAGTIASRPFGALDYRLYEDNDRIKLLWVLTLPNATAEQLGMPTGSQRDNALAGQGRPWMMRAGTPAAHLMIPINGTELSN